jgi:hypothetical protein
MPGVSLTLMWPLLTVIGGYALAKCHGLEPRREYPLLVLIGVPVHMWFGVKTKVVQTITSEEE